MSKERFGIRILNLIILLVFFLENSLAQEKMKAIITRHNLQSVTARTTFQYLMFDRQGLMYVATSDGIIIYTGTSEKFILNSQVSGEHGVTAMVEDQDGVIWVGCDDGVIYRIIDKAIYPWDPREGLPRHKIAQLVVDDKNRLWIATNGEGVYVIDNRKLIHFGYEDGLKRLEINDIIFSKRHGLLISTDLGLQELQYNDGIKKVRHFDNHCLEERNLVQDLVMFDEDLYLNELSKGIIRHHNRDTCDIVWPNKPNELVIKINLSGQYQSILTDKALYFKSISPGSNEKEGKNKSAEEIYAGYTKEDYIIKTQSDFEISEVQTILLDDKNTLWVLLKYKGLISIFLPISRIELKGKTVQDIDMIQDGKDLLLCTESGLQIRSTADGRFKRSLFDKINLTSIYRIKQSDIFLLGTYGSGLIRYDYQTNSSVYYHKEQGLPDNHVLQVTGNEHYIWITTLNGILRIENTSMLQGFSNPVVYNEKNGLPTNFLYQILPVTSDRIWIATDGNGICYLDPEKYCVEEFDKLPAGSSVYNMDYTRDGTLFFNVAGKGLGYILSDKEDHVHWLDTPVKSLEFEGISLFRDSLIMAAGNGFLLMLNPHNRLSITMDEEFGLAEIIPSLNAMYRDENDVLWIGCQNHLIKVEPEIYTVLTRPGNFFNSVKVNGLPVSIDVQGNFDYQHNQFTFEFTAIHYLASDHINYKYILEGYDQLWLNSKEGRESYSNLSPGKYKFRVQASIDNTFDSSNEIQYAFKIHTPFWMQWWFILGSVGFLSTVAYFTNRWWQGLQRKELAIRQKTTALQFEILRSQVNPHFLFNSFNSVISLIEEDKKKAIQYTEQLSDYFRNILKYRDVQLISLEEEMTILMNYMELLNLRHPNQIQLKKGEFSTHVYIAPMTLQLLMENAIKHNEITNASPLQVVITCQDDFLVFKNSVMRKKLPVDSTGFGLQSIRLRYQLLTDKEIRIEKKDDYFSVEIPLLFKEV